MKKKVLSVCLALCMVSALSAVFSVTVSADTSGTCGENLTWTLDDSGTLTISGVGDMYDYEMYDYDVSPPWYSNKESIKTVVINRGMTSIGICAFADCSNLESIEIPDSVTSIRGHAFVVCSSLKSVTIGNGVTSIEALAFYGCSNLTYIEIPDSVTSIGSSAFSGTAWYNNQPDGLVYAGKVAYAYKGAMPVYTEIVLKDGTKEIAGHAFYDRNSLTSVTIPDGVTSIGQEAFGGCSSLSDVYYVGSEDDWEKIVIGYNNGNLLSATIPKGDGPILVSHELNSKTINIHPLCGWIFIFSH